jgi:hypothetical protein
MRSWNVEPISAGAAAGELGGSAATAPVAASKTAAFTRVQRIAGNKEQADVLVHQSAKCMANAPPRYLVLSYLILMTDQVNFQFLSTNTFSS